MTILYGPTLFRSLQARPHHVASLFQFILARAAADAEYHTEVDAIDNRGRSASTNHGEGLARNGEKPDGHKHIDAGLYGHEQDEAHRQKGWEIALAATGYSPSLEKQEYIKGCHSNAAEDTHFLEDDGIDKVAIRLLQIVARDTIAWAAT